MINKQYKFAETVVEIITPFNYEVTKPFSDYICQGLNPDYTATFEFTSELPVHEENIVMTTDDYVVTQKNGLSYIHYYDSSKAKFYACRITNDKDNCCNVLIDKDYEGKIWTRLVFTFIGIEEILAKNNSALFHSSYLDMGGEALLFTGPCGMGKSTQANLWAKHRGLKIVNGDKSLLYFKDGKARVGGLPYSGSSTFCENIDMPIKAIVKLSQAPYNKVEKLDSINAFFGIYNGCYPIAYSKEIMNMQMNFAERFAQKVFVCHLACLPDESAVKCLEEFLNVK